MKTIEELGDYFGRCLADALIHENKETFSEALSELSDVPSFVFQGLPKSSNGFSFKGVSVPGRNDVCICGSGKKFKKCCQSHFNVSLPTPFSLFVMALSSLSEDQFEQLVDKPNWTIEAASIATEALSERGLDRLVIKLTLPLLGGKALIGLHQLRNEHQEFVSSLLDSLFEVGDDDLRMELMKKLSTYKSAPSLQSLAHQRLAMIASQDGNAKQAQEHLTKAFQADPNQVELPMSELSILGVTGDDQTLRSRARFWKARILKRFNPDYPVLEFIDQVIEQGKTLFDSHMAEQDQPMDEVEEINASNLLTVLASNDVVPCYDLKIKGTEATLVLDKETKKPFKKWKDAYQQHSEKVEQSVGRALDEDELGKIRWQFLNNDWLDIAFQNPQLLMNFDWLDEVSNYVYLSPDFSELMPDGLDELKNFDKLESLFNYCQSRAVNEIIEFLPEGVTLPSRLKANQGFWQIAFNTYSVRLETGKTLEELADVLETFLSLDAEPKDWVVRELAWVYLHQGKYNSIIEMMSKISRISFGSYLIYAYAHKLDKSTERAIECLHKLQRRNKKLLIALRQALIEEDSGYLYDYLEILSFYWSVMEPEISEFREWLVRNLPSK